VIIGAGAVGGGVGGALARSGHDVLLVARGAHGEAIRGLGLTLREPDALTTERIACVAMPSEVDYSADDVVVLAVKSHQAEEALVGVDSRVAIVCVQNGVATEPRAHARFARVYGMMSWIPALHLEPGVVDIYAHDPAGVFRVGRYAGGDDPLADEIAQCLARSGFDAEAVPAIMRWKRAKLLNNLGNVLDAFCAREDGLVEVSRRAATEGAAVLRAANLEFMPAEQLFADMRDRLDHRATIDGKLRAGGSTWQSASRGLETELDDLNGWVCRLGAAHGIPTPVNRALCRLPAEANGPRSISVARVHDLIDSARGVARLR
jgi:2-dehydropantoate 2-reductase